jgi:hypothetical protein
MAMFAFVGDRLVRKDDLYSYQVMEKTIKTVIPSLYKVNFFLFFLFVIIEVFQRKKMSINVDQFSRK